MSSKSKKLGNLADIFQTEVLDGTIRKISIEQIEPAIKQPRVDRTKGVEELSNSLQNEGLLQPIIVTKKENSQKYTIIAGERRYHAAKLLNWKEIECKILDKNEKETYKIAVIENLQRENLSPYEEIESMSFLKNYYQYTDTELGNIFGKSRNYISELLSISSLSSEQLQICKETGIESKNLLVQAVKASKNGSFLTFIKKYQTGEVNTVKDAKNFNKNKQEILDQDTEDRTDLIIQREKDTIFIHSEDKKLLDKIEKLIRSRFLR